MVNALYYCIIAIMLINLLIDVGLEVLNLRYKPNRLPQIISDIYDNDSYLRQQSYEQETTRFAMIESIFTSAVAVLFFAFGGFALLHALVSDVVANKILQTLLFFGALALASFTISIPFSYYDKFVVEERYGFNKTTMRVFVTDIFKSLLISTVVGGLIIGLITWLFYFNPLVFWILALLVVVVFVLLMNALYSTVLLPLFNKKTPLPEGELKRKVIDFANSLNFSINSIFVIDGSKRSTKGNAFFSGFGRKKSIFLYDPLLEKLSDDEVLAVLAHELGHYKKHHVWVNLLTGVVTSGLFLFLFNRFAQSETLTQVMGGLPGSGYVFHLNLIAFVMLVEPVQTLIGLATNQLSRSMEYAADRFAADHGMAMPLGRALKKLAALNYSNLTPHPWYVAVNYSHPTLLMRLVALGFEEKEEKHSSIS